MLVALSALVWAAARLGSVITGGTTEPFGMKFVADLAHGQTRSAWPHTPTAAVIAAAVVLAVVAAFTMRQYVQTDLEADRQVANTLAALIIGGSLASVQIPDETKCPRRRARRRRQ